MASTAFSLLQLLLFAGASIANPTSYKDTLEWQACPAWFAPQAPDIQCAYTDVPMNWDNTRHGGFVRIGVTRLPARRPESRIGNLLYNPGGPGGFPSMSLANFSTAQLIHPEVMDSFDIIGIDLRGSGLSDPIKCDGELYNQQLPQYPGNEAEFEQLVKRNQEFRQSCLNMTGTPLFDYMDTVSIVKDHEAVRKRMGGEPWTYLGQSYGTQLGSQYAELFPDSFRAILLDCSVAAGQPEMALHAESSASVEVTFQFFLGWCKKQNSTVCPLAQLNQTAEEIWTRLLERAAKSPIEVPVCKKDPGLCITSEINDFDMIQTALSSLYHPAEQFSFLAEAIYEAAFKDNATLFAGPSQTSMTTYAASENYANVAITCQDWGHNDTSYTDVHYKELLGKSEARLMRGWNTAYAFQHQCTGLPPPKRNPPHAISIPESKNLPIIFMIENVYDPATAMPWSVILHDMIGKDRSVLSTRIAPGHTVYFQSEAYDGPAVRAMNDYLLDLKVPEPGTVFQWEVGSSETF